MIGIVDYGAGNLRSVANALDRLGRRFVVCDSPAGLERCDVCVLPGVGQFASAMRRLRERGLDDALRDWVSRGRRMVGICLGLQLLFDGSDESQGEAGLGLIPGSVVRLQTATVPHMGWNTIRVDRGVSWLEESADSYFYFAHSFIVQPVNNAAAAATVEIDGCDVPVAVESGSIRAVQFHPEKSGSAGAALLERMLSC